MNTKFAITGVPRSGTTIIAKYFNSIPGLICLNEPHETIARSGLYVFNGLSFNKNDDLQIDNIINFLLLKHKMAGFKDTYVHHNHTTPAWPMRSARSKLFTRYHNNGYVMIYILRDPIEVCNSMIYKRKNCKNIDAIVDVAIQNYEKYLDFIGDRVIIYSEFCKNPNQSVSNVIKDIIDVPHRFILKNMHGIVTDKHAFKSTDISGSIARFILDDHQINKIKESGICDKYGKMIKEICQ